MGAWLFRQRSWIPLPLVAALLLIPADDRSPAALVSLGALLVAGGEALRLWAVRHIGVISRTRSDRLGPIVRSGPFAYVRNPLYLGNIAIWTGFVATYVDGHARWLKDSRCGEWTIFAND